MTEPQQQLDQRWTVHDGAQTIQFTGELLADVNNYHPGRHRWTTVRVFRTAASNYILTVTAYSTVYHRIPSVCRTSSATVMPLANVPDDAESCLICQPPNPHLKRDPSLRKLEVKMEGSLHKTRVADTPLALSQIAREMGGIVAQAFEAAVRDGKLSASELTVVIE